MFDNNLEFNQALELETGLDQPGSSQIIPPAQPNWFPILEDSEEMNIAGGNSSVLGEFDNSAAQISYGMNKENPIEITDDDDSPSARKKIMDPPLFTEGSSSGGQNKKGKGSQSNDLVAERKRRAKLNQRLLSLRSVVPKITIHMCCSCRPGMLHSIAKKLNNLGIEIQDAVLNCHDGALILDLYRAQQINDVTEELIKAMLLETVNGVV